MLNIQQRVGYLLVSVMVAQIILISVQVNTKSGVPVLEAVIFGVFSEAQRAVSAVVAGVRTAWRGYVALRGVHQENEALRRQVADLRVQMQQQRALAQSAERLQRLLDLRVQTELPTVGARVVASDATPWFRTVTINKGATDGLSRDMAIIAPAGVVGRVVGEPGLHAAKVQLLIDRNAAAGATIERSRAAGVVVGSDGDPPLEMEYVSNLADVQVGDAVVTSGIDGVYPKGFLIGRVEKVEHGVGLYKTIRVRPNLDFSSLEDVLVVLVKPSAPVVPEGGE